MTVSDHGTMWVEAVLMSDVPSAEGWAKRAAALAPEIWQTLAERRSARAR